MFIYWVILVVIIVKIKTFFDNNAIKIIKKPQKRIRIK